LVKLGHNVDFIGLHPQFDELENHSFVEAGVRVHYVAPMHVMKRGDNKSYYSTSQLIRISLQATWRLSQSINRSDVDILHVGKPHPMNGIAGLWGKLTSSKNLFVDCDDFEAASGRFTSSWQKGTVAFFEKNIPRQAIAVTTNTEFMRDKLISWGISNEKIIYLPNGVDTDRISTPDPASIKSLQRELGLENKYVIAFIGSISLPSHPVQLLIEAFYKIYSVQQDTRLLFVGGGEDVEYLKKLTQQMEISDVITFCGKVPREKISQYYAIADVTVDPVHDNDAARGRQPLKLFESWYYGVPFVSGDVGDRKQLLGEPQAGLLSQPGDPDSLAEALLTIINNPGRAEDMRILGHERVKPFTWKGIAADLEKQYMHHASLS